jgi:hypothetical protein
MMGLRNDRFWQGNGTVVPLQNTNQLGGGWGRISERSGDQLKDAVKLRTD